MVLEIQKLGFDPKTSTVLMHGRDRQGAEHQMLLYPQTLVQQISSSLETTLETYLRRGVGTLPFHLEDEILVLWKPTGKTLEGEKLLGAVKVTVF